MMIEPEHDTCSQPELLLDRLPPTRTRIATIRAERRTTLPALFTTAVHGALQRTLYENNCGSKNRDAVTGGRCDGECAYCALIRPAIEDSIAGLTNGSPGALALAPCDSITSSRPRDVLAGRELSFRLTLIGERSFAHERALHVALSQAIDALAPLGEEAGRFRLRSLSLEPARTIRLGSSLALQLLTPARLKSDGKFAGRLSAGILWAAILRRADLAAQIYGGGSIFGDGMKPLAPFQIDHQEVRVLRIARYSSRQAARMTWPGLIGSVLLTGEGLATAAPLLAFIRAAQIGKATSFGFGRVELEGDES